MQDLRYAARLLKRHPRFTLLATLTMALGIGATSTLFSVTYGVLLKPLPWPGGDRVVVVKETRGGKPPRFNSFTNAAYVNRAFARRYLNDDALGAKLPMGVGYQDAKVEATVIGVVDDVRYVTTGDSTQPEMYYSYRQFGGRVPVPVATFLLRTSGDPSRLATELRSAIRQADGTLVPEAVATMEERVLSGLARPRLYTVLLGGFAIFALIVAGVGLFAVLSQVVTERSREIAVRSALGARSSNILRLVAGQGLAIAAAGLLVGGAVAAVSTRSLSTVLYGVTPHDLWTFIAVPIVLMTVAVVACIVPARRAITLDPVRVLKGE
jgi:putative ABC transport system permease protein